MTTRPRFRVTGARLALAALVFVTACSGGGPSVDRFCRQVADLIETDALSLASSAADDPAIRSGLEQTASQLDEVVAAAPDEVRDSVEVIAGLTRALAEAVASTDQRDPFERSAELLAAQQQYDDTLGDAVDTFNTYVARHCVPQPGG